MNDELDMTAVVQEELDRAQDETDLEQPEATEPDLEQPGDSEQEPEPAPASPKVEIDGQSYDLEELRAYARTLQWARSDPARWEQIVEWERRGYILPTTTPSPATQPAPATGPEDGDWVDPRVAALEARLAATEATINAQRETENRHAIDLGLEQFKQSHPTLTGPDLEQVLLAARDWKLIAAAAEREPYPARRAAAVQQAFEAAYRITMHEKAAQEAAATASAATARDITRARRAASTSSSPRSSSRSQPDPDFTNPRELERWMATQIAEAQNG